MTPSLNLKPYDPNFYKDLQSKLNLRANENDDNGDETATTTSSTQPKSPFLKGPPQQQQPLFLSRAHTNSLKKTNNLFANSIFGQRSETTTVKNGPLKDSKHHHRHHHHHHHHHHQHPHHAPQPHKQPMNDNRSEYPQSNNSYLPAFDFLSKTTESMALNKSENSNNSNSDPPQSPSCKIICRSNSSPSYSSSSPNSSLASPLSVHTTSPLTSPSYSSLLMPYSVGNAGNSSSSVSSSSTATATSPTTVSATKPSLNSSQGFIYKSNSCSLPLTSNHTSTFSDTSSIPSPATTPTANHASLNGQFESRTFGNYYSTSGQQHSLDKATSRNVMFSVKPPEIVITESKTENDLSEYALEEAKKFNHLNKKKYKLKTFFFEKILFQTKMSIN